MWTTIAKVAVLGSLAAAAAGCGTAHAERRAQPPPAAVHTAVVAPTSFELLHRASGTVRGHTTATLTSKTSGYVKKIAVLPGDRVRAGDVLAVLEANDVEANVRRARAGLAEAEATRAEAESALEAAKASAVVSEATQGRTAELLAKGAVARQEADEVEARFRAAAANERMASARVHATKSRIDQAKAELAEAQATLAYAKIVAPFAGRVIERRVDPGNLASPGTPLLVLEQDAGLRVEVAVDESHAQSIALGDRARVDADAMPTFEATVAEIVPSVDVATRAFLVKVDLPPGASALRPGMFARVAFAVGRRTPLAVPAGAITTSGQLDRVYVVEGGRARLRVVTLGDAQRGAVEVLSGLDAGEAVVAPVPPALRDGQPVTVAP
ncbi:MAG TPA: efflux RND transporter periplasmic adaptor subunit [Minicystis sp.]|nr:efflux RND transporter periplasmic adaptor subunit [Minicystis sp.]